MAVREIKTTLAVDGEKAFNKAVTEAGRNMRVMASEMKAAAADFDLTGDEMEYMSRKSRALNGQIQQQENIIRALERAVEESAAAYGDASAKTDGYRIKLNNAQTAMAKLKKELEESNREMADLGRDSGRVGRQLEQGIGEAADDVSKKVDTMVTSLDKDLSGIGKAVNFSAFKDGFDLVKDGISGAVTSLNGFVQGTVDYRRTMSFLEQNALRVGMDPQIIKDMTLEVSALTGELDGAVEGMSNLMAANLEPDEMVTAVERLSAAVIAFPDTLKFESLADSLQESIATGQAVGQYAEYLERMGVDLDDVNKSFKKASKQGSEAVETTALAWLSNPDAEKALDTYKDLNESLLEGQKAQQEWNDEAAKTAETLEPYTTGITNYGTKMLKWFNEAFSGQKGIGGEEAADIWWLPKEGKDGKEEWKKILSNLETTFDQTKANLQKKWAEIFQVNENVEEARKNVTSWEDFAAGYDTGAEKEGKTDGEEFIGGVKKGIIDSAPQLPTWDDFAPGYDFGPEETGKEIAKGIGDGIEEESESAINKAKSLWASIAAELSKPIAGPTVGAPQTGTSQTGTRTNADGSMNVSIGMDGKIFGKVSAPYTSAQLGALEQRYETYG